MNKNSSRYDVEWNLSDDSDHNELLLLGLFLQLLSTFIAKVAVKVEICGLAFLVLASYHLKSVMCNLRINPRSSQTNRMLLKYHCIQ